MLFWIFALPKSKYRSLLNLPVQRLTLAIQTLAALSAFRHSETLGICEVDGECVIQVSEFRDRPDLVCVFFNFFGVIREEFVGF